MKKEIVRYQPPPDPIEVLRTENESLRQEIAKLENKILSLRNERAAFGAWLQWLRGHLAASGIFDNPNYIAESVWKDPPPSWRAGGEGGRIDPRYPLKRQAGNNSAFFTPTDERPIKE